MRITNEDSPGDTSPEASSDVFTALAHPTRRQILQDLKEGELSSGEIASRFDASGPTISRHLSVLKGAGLVTERRDANRILYSQASDRLAVSVGGFLSAVCPEQMIIRSHRRRRDGETAAAGGGGGDKPADQSADHLADQPDGQLAQPPKTQPTDQPADQSAAQPADLSEAKR